MRCSPHWRCLRYGCPRCDRERRLQAERKDATRKALELHRAIAAYDQARSADHRRAADDPEVN